MVKLGLYPAKAEKTRWIERKEGVIVLSPKTGDYAKLNETASYVWQVCNGVRTVRQISGLLSIKYNIEKARAEKDLIDILKEFLRLKIIKFYADPGRFYPRKIKER